MSIERGATWIAIATTTVVDQTGAPVAGVDVKATWNFENTDASCRTDTAGKCSMYRSGLPTTLDAVTITIAPPLNGAKTIRREGVN
ncbi:MAG: carboxypeptidase-like regulatory domain-containing protein [Acidimicrobiales bacterium]